MAHPAIDEHARHAADSDDRTAGTRRHHGARALPQCQECTTEVDAHHAVPLFRGEVEELCHAADARVDHCNVETAVLRDDLTDRADELRFVSDVTTHREVSMRRVLEIEHRDSRTGML